MSFIREQILENKAHNSYFYCIKGMSDNDRCRTGNPSCNKVVKKADFIFSCLDFVRLDRLLFKVLMMDFLLLLHRINRNTQQYESIKDGLKGALVLISCCLLSLELENMKAVDDENEKKKGIIVVWVYDRRTDGQTWWRVWWKHVPRGTKLKTQPTTKI